MYAVNEHADVVQSLPAYRLCRRDIPGAGRAGGDRRAGRARRRRRARVRSGRRPRAAGDLGGLRRGGPGGCAPPAGADRGVPRRRASGSSARTASACSTPPRRSGLNATFAPQPAIPGGSASCRRAAASGSRSSRPPGASAWASRRSSRSATRPTCPATTSCSTGSRTRAPTSRCCTSSRSATRASSRRIAPRFARRKPLLAVKSGRSAAGARATSSHTGALLSASDVTVDALFQQAGVIRTDTLHELFAVASLLTTQPMPRGDRVAIVTNAGGPGDHVRRRLPGRRRRGAGAAAGGPGEARRVPAAGRVARQPDRHDRHRLRRGLPADAFRP